LVPPQGGGHYYPDSGDGHWLTSTPIASPLSRLSGYETLGGWRTSLGGVAVEVRCVDGMVGVGVAHGGLAACFVVEHALGPLLEGADSADVAGAWEKLTLASSMYGPGGLVQSALSGIDLALWDLAAKREDVPVARLISTTAADEVETYATGPRPDVYESAGFTGAKVDLPWGLAAGADGLEKNVEFLSDWRARLAPDFFLAVDCLMALEPEYVHGLLARTAELHLAWIEEPLLPWEFDELKRLRHRGSLVASGEHNTGTELHALVARGAVDIVQPELTWCGGMTEALRIAAAAAARDLPVVPHCGGIFSYHFAAALETVRRAEFLFHSADGVTPVAAFDDLLLGEPLPLGGRVSVPTDAGWGVRLRPDLTRPIPRVEEASGRVGRAGERHE
jgi:L-rhamnonate dehydratase